MKTETTGSPISWSICILEISAAKNKSNSTANWKVSGLILKHVRIKSLSDFTLPQARNISGNYQKSPRHCYCSLKRLQKILPPKEG
jgi:hypothetical protein